MVESYSDSDPNSLLSQISQIRGFSEADLKAGIDTLPDEGLLANIEKAADRVSKAMFKNEPLVIFGHDDPDGVTSTYILYQFFNSCGYQRHNYYIPNRNLFSHGIQQDFVDFVRKGGYSLVITVDNGIASYEGVEKLNRLGCETIITDHHLVQPDQLPRAHSIVNPQLPNCPYPYKSLAGVGVTLMFIRYLGKILGHPIPLSSYFWTAAGSLADKVPMTGLNRILVRHVIEHWPETDDPSIDFLLRNYNRIDGNMDIFNFMLYTARLIANGREEDGQHTAMRFLLQMGDAKAGLFQNIEAQKKAWESELNRVFSFLDTISAGFDSNSYIYFDDEDVIPYPLLGTAATYILNKLGIPTIMLKMHNGDIVCEGRCGEGFNMVEAFADCKEHLKQFGGHVKAAGFTLMPDKYDGFLECYNHFLNASMNNNVPGNDNAPDAILTLNALNRVNWEDLELLLPFGQQNPEPRILLQNVNLDDLQQSFTIEHNSHPLPWGKRGAALVYWKSPNTLRVLAFHENKAAG